ncbi:MAG: hypothetical protein FJ318_07080 [SAR202 cluster bacterium]|nr:hypothetical protein [SAR202 cluster bacterium]
MNKQQVSGRATQAKGKAKEMAGRTASVSGTGYGTLNGAMVWAFGLVLALLLAALGGGAALGAFGLGDTTAETLFGDTVLSSIWWTFIAMAVGLVIAAIGGMLGAPKNQAGPDRTVR